MEYQKINSDAYFQPLMNSYVGMFNQFQEGESKGD